MTPTTDFWLLAFFIVLTIPINSVWSDTPATSFMETNKTDVVLPTKQRLTVQNYILIWLDPKIHRPEHDYHTSIARLQEIINVIYPFDHVGQGVDFLKQIKEEKVFLILSDDLLRETIPTVHNMSQIYSIYLFTRKKANNEEGIGQWTKIRGIFTDIDLVFDTLNQDTQQCDRDSISFSVTNAANLDRLNSVFMYMYLLKKNLMETNNNPLSKKELTAYARNHYLKNTDAMKKIGAFERNYRSDKAIGWYTQRGFLYQMLNRALRTHEIDVLIKMDFFLRDIEKQIQELRSNQLRKDSIVLLYRGQSIAPADLEKIRKTRKGDLLVFNSFFTATLNKNNALHFARSSLHHPEVIGILFNITINTSVSSIPFVSRRQVDALTNEKEGILFSIHPVFRIMDLKPHEKRLWEIELILMRDDDPQLRQIHERLRKETSKITGWQRLGDLLIRMRYFDKAENLYQVLLHSVPNLESATLPYVYNQLGRIQDKQQNYMEALMFHKKALEIQQKYFSSNHLDLVHTYNYLGSVYYNMGDYTQALDFYRKTLEIQQDLLPSDHRSFMTTYKSFGTVYRQIGDDSKALDSYQKVLHIQERSLPSDHPDLIASYSTVASIYHNRSEYSNALLFYEKLLKIYQKSFSSDHPSIAMLYQNIGKVYQDLEQYSKALKYFQKALKMQHEYLPLDDPTLAATYRYIALAYYQIREYSKALEFFNKTLDIQQKSLPPNHSDLASTYDDIGLSYRQLKQYSTAASFFERAIQIAQLSSSEHHSDLELYQQHLQSLKDEL